MMLFFDERFSSALAYTSQPHLEAMTLRPYVTYTPCVTSSREKTGNIITFTHFEEGSLLSENCEDAVINDKIVDEYDDDSVMPPLLSVEETNAMDYGDESDDEPMYTEMFEKFVTEVSLIQKLI